MTRIQDTNDASVYCHVVAVNKAFISDVFETSIYISSFCRRIIVIDMLYITAICFVYLRLDYIMYIYIILNYHMRFPDLIQRVL